MLKEKQSDNKKGGRPRKERTGLPQIDIISAINYTKKAHDKVGTALKSFKGMAEATGMDKAFATRGLAELREYGLMEQDAGGWKVSNLGMRVSLGDRNGVIEIVQKSEIIGDLYNTLKDKHVDKDYIENFIKSKRYKYKISISTVADRFIQIMKYIEELGTKSMVDSLHENEIDPKKQIQWINLIKLKYAIQPPKEDVAELADKVAKDFENATNTAVKDLTQRIKKNRDKKEILSELIDSLLTILLEDYPQELFEALGEELPNIKKED